MNLELAVSLRSEDSAGPSQDGLFVPFGSELKYHLLKSFPWSPTLN